MTIPEKPIHTIHGRATLNLHYRGKVSFSMIKASFPLTKGTEDDRAIYRFPDGTAYLDAVKVDQTFRDEHQTTIEITIEPNHPIIYVP